MVLDAYPRSRIEWLGGNADYGFFGIGTPEANLIMILARQMDPPKLPEGSEPLPKDAPGYAFAAIYPTYSNPKE